MANELFNAICFERVAPGKTSAPLKYRKISNRDKFIKFIQEKPPNIWYINWYEPPSEARKYIGRTYLK